MREVPQVSVSSDSEDVSDVDKAFATWKQRIEYINNPQGKGVVKIDRGAFGDTLGLMVPPTKFLKLSGSGSPYTGQEVYPSASGAWTVYPSPLNIPNVYEYNGLYGLAGKVVKTTLVNSDEWRFRYNIYGSGGGTGCTVWYIAFHPTGCLGSPSDGLVTLSGPLSGTATIDSTGWATFTYTTRPPNGSYTATCTSTKYDVYTRNLTITASSFDITCGVGGGMPLVPDSSHICCNYPNYIGCKDPLPKTLKLDTAVGSCALVYDSSTAGWFGTIPVAALHCTFDAYGNCTGADMSGTALFTFLYLCDRYNHLLSGGITMTWAKSPGGNLGPPLFCDRAACVIADPTCGYVNGFGGFAQKTDNFTCMPQTFTFDPTIDYVFNANLTYTCPSPFAGNATVSIPP